MSIRKPCYLALTAAEFLQETQLPEKAAYMACHFSCYGTGLSNLPDNLPDKSLIILNDRTPADRHESKVILSQMEALVEKHAPYGVLLDFQRQDVDVSREVAQLLTGSLPCPVGVTLPYGEELNCPLFLPPPPLHMPLDEHLAAYGDREIWLEVAPETQYYIVTENGCCMQNAEGTELSQTVFSFPPAFCHYCIETSREQIRFTLQRSREDISLLLDSDRRITCGIGLYQQFRKNPVG